MNNKKKLRSYLDDELSNYSRYRELLRNKRVKYPLALERIERLVQAIEYTIGLLNDEQRQLFVAVYLRHRQDVLIICDEIGISFSSYRRYKEHIIWTLGKQLGYCEDTIK